MKRTSTQRGTTRASAFRRVLTAFLAAVYLVAGFAGEISCAKETLVSTSISAALDKGDEGSKKAPTVVEHCSTCAPITVPVAALVYIPASMSLQMSFSSDIAVDLEVRLPEPPPPKHLI